MLTSGSSTPPLCSIGISSATQTRAYDVPTFQRLLISALHSSNLRHLHHSLPRLYLEDDFSFTLPGLGR
ncbi:hypothetical protein BT96DRAFT_661339 [Gymnopus androsaceus JB14]|uniref:Uncharacterized protein n=1 Tax=Gymnopus androsaceus JB14 TaxID=1447944 RepID=A0A6A4GFD3_9AGAR|nr:hypothetical protein BT96DRAFT_661339 [Gymnopus androsaceus JB14]